MRGFLRIGIEPRLQTSFLLHKSGNQERTSLRPVSYTHLDVYKRQLLISLPVSVGDSGKLVGVVAESGCLAEQIRVMGTGLCPQLRPHNEGTQKLLTSQTALFYPVSYTHLQAVCGRNQALNTGADTVKTYRAEAGDYSQDQCGALSAESIRGS